MNGYRADPSCAAVRGSGEGVEVAPADSRSGGPADKTAVECIVPADRKTGQLDKANADQAGAGTILDTCGRWQAEAAAAAKTPPWWKL